MNTSSYGLKHIYIYIQGILNTTTVVVLRGYNMKSRIFHNYGFLKQVYITYESMLDIVSNNAIKSG